MRGTRKTLNRKFLDALKAGARSLQNNRLSQAIRGGLVTLIPVALLGSFALVLKSFPYPAYQTFIAEFDGGILLSLFTAINNTTFGMLSIYTTLFISLRYAHSLGENGINAFGAPLASLAGFVLLTGFMKEGFSLDAFGVKGMFTSIFSASVASWLVYALRRRSSRLQAYSEGADMEFQNALAVIVPILITIVIMALANTFLSRVFGVTGFHELFIKLVNDLYENMGRSLFSAQLYVLLSSLLWFFGMHGSNILEGVAQDLLVPGSEINTFLIAAGQAPTEIIHKNFIDIFVLMGGCGTAMSLLLAIFLFSRNRSSRRLAKTAALPMLFNINELLVFGLPIVFNVYLLLPFLFVPLLCSLTSYTAMLWGWVPLAVNPVEWTTPVLIGGWIATGSPAGALLQLFNLALGVLVYWPFILLSDKKREHTKKEELDAVIALLQEAEAAARPISLLEYGGSVSVFCKMLAADLSYALLKGQLNLYYQPQYDATGHCIGSEALLRWKHPSLGMMYPPLVVKLAEESGYLDALEQFILTRAARDAKTLRQNLGGHYKTSVNITAENLYNSAFESFLRHLLESGQNSPGLLWLELTEEKAMIFDAKSAATIRRLRSMGYPMIIDDFSMGHTSLSYLKSNDFDMVKLDGSLIQEMQENTRCRDIIASILSLAEPLHFVVLAEYVETEEQRRILENMGCTLYQGYLYSPAIPFDALVERLEREESEEKQNADKRLEQLEQHANPADSVLESFQGTAN